jgi:hypothetical protein
MKKVLFDSQSWLKENPADHVEEFLECTSANRENYANETDLLGAVHEWLQDLVQYDWEDFLELTTKEEGRCLVTGYFMSWMGPQEGGKVFASLTSAIKEMVMDDSHIIFSIDENGLLTLDETHHDAPCKGNYYEFRILTSVGNKYYNSHCNDDRRSLCEALLTNKRSRNVKLKTFYLSAKDFADTTL